MSIITRPLLWQLDGTAVYLLGTIHLGPPCGYELGGEFPEIFAAVGTVVFEIGPKEAAFDPTIIRRSGGTLEGDVGSDFHQLLTKHPRYRCELEELVAPMVMMNLALGMYEDIGLSVGNGVDQALTAKALQTGKACAGFESANTQLRAIASISNEDVRRGLHYILEEPTLMRKICELIKSSFETGTEEGMQTVRDMSMEWSPAVATKLFFEREAQWLPRITSIVGSGSPTLIAVGAAHVTSGNGLLRLLSDKGIHARRI